MDLTPHERLERATWDLFWLPPRAKVVDRPELLALRAGESISLNTVLRVRAPEPRLPALIAEVVALHAGVPSRWTIPDTIARAPVERAVSAAGYLRSHEHHARVVHVDRYTPRPSPGVTVRRVVDEDTLRDCWHVADVAFGDRAPRPDADVPVELAQCAAPDARVQRFVAYVDGEPASSGGMSAFDDLSIGLLWAGATVPHARGRGLYSAIVAARMQVARARGLAMVGLYARVNTSSPVVEAQGFERCGHMTYWERPARD